MIKRLARPEFLYGPSQILVAARQKISGDEQGEVVCKLPWGLPVLICPQEFIGLQVYRYGIAALGACEIVFRIIARGDTVLDIGANAGIVTAAMAMRLQNTGKVVAFEMMPKTFERLCSNVARWGELGRSIKCLNIALSSRDGIASAGLPPGFDANSGLAYVLNSNISAIADHRQITVTAQRLDGIVESDASIRLAKIDVERHEFDVLQGAGRLISNQKIENILFEDSVDFCSPAKNWLRSCGYVVFELIIGLRGPSIRAPERFENDGGGSKDFIATIRPDDLIRRLKPRGYMCLRSSPLNA